MPVVALAFGLSIAEDAILAGIDSVGGAVVDSVETGLGFASRGAAASMPAQLARAVATGDSAAIAQITSTAVISGTAVHYGEKAAGHVETVLVDARDNALATGSTHASNIGKRFKPNPGVGKRFKPNPEQARKIQKIFASNIPPRKRSRIIEKILEGPIKKQRIEGDTTVTDRKHRLDLGLDDGPRKRAKGTQTLITLVEYNRRQHKKNPHFEDVTLIMPGKRRRNGIPATRTVTHRWSTNEVDLALLTDDTTVAARIPVNALENPFTGAATTTNAMLFDQLAAIYERYTVTKATIRCDFFNDSALDGVVVGISLKDDATQLTDTGHYAELGDTIYKTLTPKEHSQIVMTGRPGKFFGVKAVLADDRLSCQTGGDARPDNTLFFHIWIAPIDGANTTASAVRCYITIVYTAVWQQPLTTARSTFA